MRAQVAIINFAFFVRGLLIDSYINSEIFAGIWRKINYCNRCAHHPNYWDFSPSQKPPFGNPWLFLAHKNRTIVIASNFRILQPEKVFLRMCLPKFGAKFGWKFWGWIPTKTLYFMNKRSESFRKFLGRLRMILCYWKTFTAPKHWRSQIARNPAERRGFGLRNRNSKSPIASDFPSHPENRNAKSQISRVRNGHRNCKSQKSLRFHFWFHSLMVVLHIDPR